MATALLLMDIQQGILANYEDDADYLARLATAADAARANDVKVIYVRVAFRPGHPEVSDRNPMFSAIAGYGKMVLGSGDDEILPEVAPLEGEVVLTKKRVSAFAGSDLAVVLSAAKVDHLVLAGVATSGVVLSTVREAADKDFAITVLADGCRDQDPEVHQVLTEKVFPRQATVTTVAEWVASLG